MTRSSAIPLASVLVATLGTAAGFDAHAEPSAKLLADRVPVSQAQRTVRIGPATHYVNVELGEVVRFVSGDKEFAFNFDGTLVAAFDLERVAPAGSIDHHVTVYVNDGPNNPYSF